MCQCIPPVAAFGLVLAAALIQVILACVSIFSQQWVNCNFTIPLIREFSFGLSKIKLDLTIWQQDVIITELAQWVDDVDPLVDANGYVRIVTLFAMSLGIIAGGLSVWCLVRTVHFKQSFLNWMSGLFFTDAMFVLIGLLIYEMGVCPAIHDMGIGNMLNSIIQHTSLSTGSYFQDQMIEAFIQSGTECTNQSRRAGATLAAVQIVILFGAGILLSIFVDLGEEQARMVPLGWDAKGKGKGMQMQELYGPRPGGYGPDSGGGYGLSGGDPARYGKGGPPGSGGDQSWGLGGKGGYGPDPGGYGPKGGKGGLPPGSGGDQSWGPGAGAYQPPSGGDQSWGPGAAAYNPGPGYGPGGGRGMPPPPPMGYGPG